jgi:SNF2 family DNA or RNA helicase
MAKESPPKYDKHSLVRLRRNPKETGVIINEPVRSAKGWQYQVFFSGIDRPFVAESDLLPNDEVVRPRIGNVKDLLRTLALTKLRHPLADNIYSLYASRTKFEVYQFKPALKFLNSPDQRLLIADEVGLGKTIEAGIIFSEMQARADILRVLVVCPSGLRYKWQDEMRSRFDETFVILDTDSLKRFLQDYDRQGANTRLKGIVSLELARRQEFTEALAENHVHFDLVIIDEAHHCRNTGTLANNLASILSDNADALLLLTATPLQLGNQDLFHLLNILSPGDFDNLDAFNLRLEPNQHINAASRHLATGNTAASLKELRKVESTSESQRFLRDPYYQEITQQLQLPNLTRENLVIIERRLHNLNTLAHVFTRTQKRDVLEQTPIRTAYALLVRFTPAEREFYESVINYVREDFKMTTGNNWAPVWVVMMRERQAASCISAARERFAQERQQEYRPTTEDETITQVMLGLNDEPADSDGMSSLRHANELMQLADAVVQTDTKFDVFLNSLRQVLAEDIQRIPARPSKILVFSFFRGTLEYLDRRLRELGFGVSVIHGGFAVADRQFVIEDFRDNPNINILLSSEVGAEGLDFQFCDTLFNYDLPWNPMRVEQRIGRIDRFGQEAKSIRIYNLIIEDSIEERIFQRLFERIGIFERAIGDLEVILGEEIRELSKQIFSSQLTKAQETALAEKAATNIVRRQQEMEDFEKERLHFMGQDRIFANEVEQVIESGRFISEAEIYAVVDTPISLVGADRP